MQPDERDRLLEIARMAVARATGAPTPDPPAPHLPAEGPPASLREPGRAFVTIEVGGHLAGCIGLLAGEDPLDDVVADAATAAATRDPRFAPVRARDLRSAEIHVSVLGDFRPFPGVQAFRPGIDGVMVTSRGRRALLLPEVAPEMGWGAREMLEAVCSKAGLPRGAWERPDAEVVVFETERFGGPALAD